MALIAVIDDSKAVRDLLCQGLARLGHRVVAGASVEEGLGLIARERPDALLLDLDMPSQDGVSCLRALRANPATAALPVFMVTAAPGRQVIVKVALLGVQGVIVEGPGLVEEAARRVAATVGATGAAPRASVAPSQFPASPASAASPTAPPTAPGRVGAAADRGQPAESAGGPEAVQRLKCLRPLLTRAELLERVDGAELKAVKPTVQQVLALTGSAGASLDSVARAVRQDQGLSLKVLKIANSPAYSRGERVENVQKAVARIGVAQLRQTILSLSVLDQFGSTSLAERIRGDWFWEHSIAVGLLASRLTRLRGGTPEAADAMFTAGLLHDVGRVIFADRLGETYAGVIDAAEELDLPLETVEGRLLLMSHAELSDRLLRRWNFSAALVNPIAMHHLSVGNARRIVPNMAGEVLTLGLADALAHALVLGSSGNDALYPIEEHARFLGLGAGHIAGIAGEVPEQVMDLRLTMLARADGDCASALDAARELAGPGVRPLHVAADPGLDTGALLTARLCAGGSSEAPNVAVVRVAGPAERAVLMDRLKAAEREAGAAGLPVLALVSGPACRFAPGMLGDRVIEHLALPARLGCVLRAARRLAGGAPAAVSTSSAA